MKNMPPSKRLYFVLLSVIVLLVAGLLGGAYATNKILQSRSQNLRDNRLQIAILNDEEHQLTKAREDIQKYNDLATIAKSVVPQDKDQAQAVRQIVNLAHAHNVAIGSITFPASLLGQGLTTSTSTIKLSQLTPVKTLPGVYSLEIDVLSDSANPVPYGNFVAFLSDLEHNRRTALISAIDLKPTEKDPSTLTFKLVLNEYIKP